MAGRAIDATLIASARAGEPDRYLAALLAAPDVREGLLALAAFSAELGRIGHLVTREPLMGQVRLQWWRDAAQAGIRTGNPIADALNEARLRHGLPVPVLLGLIDARACDLQDEPFADEDAFAAYLAAGEAAQFALAARVLGAQDNAGQALEVRAATLAAGRAYGLVRLLLGLPHALAQGRVPLPPGRLARAGLTSGELQAGTTGTPEIAALIGDIHAEARQSLDTARQHVAKLPRGLRTAFLPLALVGPYLRALERPGRNPLRDPADVAPLLRIWRIAGAHWFGRL